jgi:hypothetical protein
MSDDRGQALVETLWLVPFAVGAMLSLVGVGGALVAESVADGAAEAAAIAELQGSDSAAAARKAAGGIGLTAVAVTSGHREVRVEVLPGKLPAQLAQLTRAGSVIKLGGAYR